MICSRYDVITVPFPFVDRPKMKKRPAVVLSNKAFNSSNHTILAMITTKKSRRGQVTPKSAIMPMPDYVSHAWSALSFFTLDNRLLQKKIGHLSEKDSSQLTKHLCFYLVACG